METNKLVAGIVAAAIAVIVLAGVLMPALSNATTTTDTFNNTGVWRMSPNDNGSIYSFDNSTKIWSLNGEPVAYTYTPFSETNVVALDNIAIRSNGWVRGTTITGNSVNTIVTNDNDTITITGDGLIYSTDGNVVTTQGYGANPNGDYIMTAYQSKAYMNGDSPVYATGSSSLGDIGLSLIHIEGTIKDGFTATVNPVYNSGYTYSDIVIEDLIPNYSTVNGYLDLYELTSITGKISLVATSTSDPSNVKTITEAPITYSAYVVPYEITAEKAVHLSDPMNTILNVIPIIIIVAVLLGVVAIFMIRRE